MKDALTSNAKYAYMSKQNIYWEEKTCVKVNPLASFKQLMHGFPAPFVELYANILKQFKLRLNFFTVYSHLYTYLLRAQTTFQKKQKWQLLPKNFTSGYYWSVY